MEGKPLSWALAGYGEPRAFRKIAGFPTLSFRENPMIASNQEMEIAESGLSPPQFFLHISEKKLSTYKTSLSEGPHLKYQAGGTLVRNIFIASVRVCLYVRTSVHGHVWSRRMGLFHGPLRTKEFAVARHPEIPNNGASVGPSSSGREGPLLSPPFPSLPSLWTINQYAQVLE